MKAGYSNHAMRINTNILITLVLYVFLVTFVPVSEDFDRPIVLRSLS